MSEFSRYPTLLYHNNKYYLCINQLYRHNGISKIIVLDENYTKIKSYIINESDYYMTHNLTIFKNKDSNKFFGIGGMIRNQNPFWVVTPKGSDISKIKSAEAQNKIINDHSGIYLLKSDDLLSWYRHDNSIMAVDKIPNNFVKAPRGKPYYLSAQEKRAKYESKAPEFDSNICCFFSHILGKYVLFLRANIMRGCRSVQFTTSYDLINWSEFNLIKVPSFRRRYNGHKQNLWHHDNYYMFKCSELSEKKIFFALVPYTSDRKNPNEHYIKKLMSYNCIDWIDLGCLLECKMYSDNEHLNTHVCEIIYENNIIDIYLFHRCYNSNSMIHKYSFHLDDTDIKDQLVKIKIDRNNYTPIIDFDL